MSRYAIIIRSTVDRERAHKILAQAPFGSRFEIKAARRTLPQNSLLWALLTEVAQQLPWHGQKLRPDDWKLIFLDALKREDRLVPNIEGHGFVSLSKSSSSDLTKEEMGNFLELIVAFGTGHGVQFATQTETA